MQEKCGAVIHCCVNIDVLGRENAGLEIIFSAVFGTTD